MSEPVVSLSRIASEAEQAAQQCRATGLQQRNPYPAGSDAYAEFHRRYVLQLLKQSAGMESEPA